MKEIDDFQYKSAFNKMVDAIVIIDNSSGQIIDVNKSCCQLLGFDKSELVGERISGLFDQNGPSEKATLLQGNFMYGNVIPNSNLKTKGGESIPVDLTFSTFAEQGANYAMVSLRDTRERVRYENEILLMNEQLKEANSSKDKLFSIIAHDLKNPMAALMGLSGLMFEDGYDISMEEAKRMANDINQLSKDTFDLLDNLLNWAQVQTKRISVEKKEVNLYNVASKIVDMLRPSAELKHVELANLVLPGYMLNADENMIKTIIRNLVSNSIKFSLANTKVSIRAIDTDKMKHIIIEDQGIGMEESYIAGLFKTTIHASRWGTKSEKGTGLGLLICYEFIKLHNGDITVLSEVDKGSTFIVKLPE
jgi:PAS domain S-box-containing protein